MITIKYNNIIIHKCSSETEKLVLHFAIYKLGCGFQICDLMEPAIIPPVFIKRKQLLAYRMI